MIAVALPPSVHAAGDLVTRTETWAVTTDTEETYIYPTLPNGKQIRVTHTTHTIACHHLPTGRQVVFSKKKVNWYDSRKQAPRLRKPAWHAPAVPVSSDWREPVIGRAEVVAEVARMGGGKQAKALVARLSQ
jgi:hypothetical protein